MMDHQHKNGQDQLSQAKPCPGSLQSADKMPTKGLWSSFLNSGHGTSKHMM